MGVEHLEAVIGGKGVSGGDAGLAEEVDEEGALFEGRALAFLEGGESAAVDAAGGDGGESVVVGVVVDGVGEADVVEDVIGEDEGIAAQVSDELVENGMAAEMRTEALVPLWPEGVALVWPLPREPVVPESKTGFVLIFEQRRSTPLPPSRPQGGFLHAPSPSPRPHLFPRILPFHHFARCAGCAGLILCAGCARCAGLRAGVREPGSVPIIGNCIVIFADNRN